MNSFAHLVGFSAKSKAASPVKVADKPAAKKSKTFDHLISIAPADLLAMAPALAEATAQPVDQAAAEAKAAKALAKRVLAAGRKGVR
jgi:hypothetical protein